MGSFIGFVELGWLFSVFNSDDSICVLFIIIVGFVFNCFYLVDLVVFSCNCVSGMV